MGKKKRAGKLLQAITEDWAGVSPYSQEMQLLRKSKSFADCITTNKDVELDCDHVNSMTVITHILYLPGEVLIERKCDKCGLRQIRLERHENSDIHYLTKWIDCGNYTPWEVGR